MRTRSVVSMMFAVLLSTTWVPAQVCTPELSGAVSVPGSLAKPAVLGNTSYVPAGTAGLAWIDITEPATPVLGGTLETSGRGMDLVADYFQSLVVMADGTGGVSVFTVGGGGAPTLAASATVGEAALSIAGSGGQFVIGTQEGSVMTIALGEESVPEVQGSVDVGGPVRGLVVDASRVYCAAGDAGLVAVDISDREAPQVMTTADLGGTVLSIIKDGSILYVGAETVGLQSLRVDISHEGETTEVAFTPLASLITPDSPVHMVTWGGHLYLAMTNVGIMAVDNSLGRSLLPLGDLTLIGSSGLALVGNMLHVGRGAQGYATVDISDCANAGVESEVLHIPAAARATGAADTYWVTDVAVANLTDGTASCNIAYLVKNQDNSAPQNTSLALQPGEQQLFHDIFDTLFDLESANGALRLTISHPDVKVTSRTYNAAGTEGTYGQFIPALGEESVIGTGRTAVLPQMQENGGFRTNVGLLNLTPLEVTVEIDLYRGTGNLIGTETVDLLPYEMTQVDRVFNTVGAGAVDHGYAVVRLADDGEEQEVLAYASVIDNDSGDPIYVPTQYLSPGTPFE